MESGGVDLLALIRSLLIAIGTGLAVVLLARRFQNWRGGRALLYGMATAFILAPIIFFVWPSLVEVPDLAGLSQAEAAERLSHIGLIPYARPLHAPGVKPGEVVPKSQDPEPLLKVTRGTMVTFSVSTGRGISASSASDSIDLFATLFRPRSGDQVHCRMYGDGIYRFAVSGSAAASAADHSLLLWVRPKRPPAETPGWYLQRPPISGIGQIKVNGTWTGIAQTGSAQWPPQEGNTVDVAITFVDIQTAAAFLASPGVLIEPDLPGLVADVAEGVEIRIE